MKKLWLNESESIDIPAVSTIDLGEVASRERSIDFTYMGSYLPNPDPVLKKAGIDQTIYRELLTDAHVGAVATSRKAGVKSMDWEIEPGDAPAQIVDFCRGIFSDYFDVDDVISQALDAPGFGYQPFEAMWTRVGNLAITTDIIGKPSEWFVYSDKNELLFRSRDHWMGEPVKPNKFIVARHEATYQNPYGKAFLALVFWWVSFKKGGIKFWVNCAEKFGMPFAVGKVPGGSDEKMRRQLLAGMKKMIQDACAVINDNESITLLEASGKSASSDLYKSLCEYCDTQISKGIVSQTLTTEIGQTGGANAAAMTHKDVLDELVTGDAKIVERLFNTVLTWNCKANFAFTGKLPKFKLYRPADLNRKAELSKKIFDLGARFTRDYFEEELNLKPNQFTLPPAPTDAAAAIGASGLLPGSPLPGRRPGASEFSAPPSPGTVRSRRVLSPHAMTLHFAAADAQATSQDKLDAAADAITPEEMQAYAEGLLKPVWPIIEKGGSPEAISEGLALAYADMNDADFEAALTQAIFISEIWGRQSADT